MTKRVIWRVIEAEDLYSFHNRTLRLGQLAVRIAWDAYGFDVNIRWYYLIRVLRIGRENGRTAIDSDGYTYREVFPHELPYEYTCAHCGRGFWHGWLKLDTPCEYCTHCVRVSRKRVAEEVAN